MAGRRFLSVVHGFGSGERTKPQVPKIMRTPAGPKSSVWGRMQGANGENSRMATRASRVRVETWESVQARAFEVEEAMALWVLGVSMMDGMAGSLGRWVAGMEGLQRGCTTSAPHSSLQALLVGCEALQLPSTHRRGIEFRGRHPTGNVLAQHRALSNNVKLPFLILSFSPCVAKSRQNPPKNVTAPFWAATGTSSDSALVTRDRRW